MDRKPRVIMVTPFPPPVVGMAVASAAVREALREAGGNPETIDTAGSTLNRSWPARFSRLPTMLRSLARLATVRAPRGGAVYMGVSGGLGQVYEILFVLLARIRGMRLFQHHECFAYLDAPRRITGLLLRLAGPDAVQIVLSPGMADRLSALYPVQRVVALSNAVLLLTKNTTPGPPRRVLRTVGFLSNISEAKGVFEFLDVLKEATDLGLPLRGELAGPFHDAKTERKVRGRLAAVPNVKYVGPKYGAEKNAFYSGIDALLFPTRYVNEAEPLTIHEAMSHGIPVIAYGRGAIPEIVGEDCGKVVSPSEPFSPSALRQIQAWLDKPAAFESASSGAMRRFSAIYSRNEQRRSELLAEMIGDQQRG